MSLQIVRNDITRIEVDAIVDPTDEFYSGTGGSDYKIHKIAGKELAKECSNLKPLAVSEVRLTKAYDLKNCRYIIHVVGPRYKDGKQGEEELLKSCYQNILELATNNNLETIAVPLIATGTYGYPKKEALKIASETIKEYLINHDLDVFLLVYDKEAFDISKTLFEDVQNYLKDNGVFDNIDACASISSNLYSFERERSFNSIASKEKLPDLKVFVPDESFKDYLRRIIIEKGLLEKDVYRASNLTKQAFNNIYNNGVVPKKENVLALAIGMKLNIDETIELLDRAGYSFRSRNKLNYIVRYFIENEIYDIQLINEFLFQEDLVALGSRYD